MADLEHEKRICRLCGKKFTPVRDWQKFCNPAHQKQYWKDVNPFRLQTQVQQQKEDIEAIKKRLGIS